MNPPLKLTVLKYLQPRMNFSSPEKVNFKNLSKGYAGEQKLQKTLNESLSPDYLIINDLRLEVNGSEFQIDTLLIGNNKVYLLEVKNYNGDFYIKDNNWYPVSSHQEINNPLHQLKRSELLLKKLLQLIGFNFSIEPYLIFINPAFYLYGATLDLPAVFPTQTQRFIQKLNTSSSKQTNDQKNLAKNLIDRHIHQSSREQLPKYEFEQLKKGIFCKDCFYRLVAVNYKLLICKKCSKGEGLDFAVMRSISEFSTLFPNKRITTNAVHEWCHIIESKKTIRRILQTHLNTMNKGRHTYYTFKR